MIIENPAPSPSPPPPIQGHLAEIDGCRVLLKPPPPMHGHLAEIDIRQVFLTPPPPPGFKGHLASQDDQRVVLKPTPPSLPRGYRRNILSPTPPPWPVSSIPAYIADNSRIRGGGEGETCEEKTWFEKKDRESIQKNYNLWKYGLLLKRRG